MKDFQRYILQDTATIKDALVALNNLSSDIQTLFVVNDNRQLMGTLTDGDVRRGLINGVDISENIRKVLFSNFRYIFEGHKDVMAIRELRNNNIELLPCLDNEMRIIRVYNLKRIKSLLPIDAVLMAGGKGERLRPLTEKTPKPLLKVGEKAIIDYNIEALICYGVENITVTTNYLAEQIETHFKNPINNIEVKCIREPKFLGTIGSLKFVEGFTRDTVLVMNSDLFTNINYEDFYLHFIVNEADMSVAAVPYSFSIPYGIFKLEGRNILGITEKPVNNYYANAGIYLIKRELLDLIPQDTFFNATDFIELLLSKNYKVIRFPLLGYWIDIGKHEDYKKAQDFVKHL